MDTKIEFAKRLSDALVAGGYAVRPSVVEREFNQRYWGRAVTLQAARRWLRGEAIPAQDKIEVLAEWLRVEPHWLRFGERVAEANEAKNQAWQSLSPRDREVIESLLALPVPQRKIVYEVILAFAQAHRAE